MVAVIICQLDGLLAAAQFMNVYDIRASVFFKSGMSASLLTF